MNRRVRAFRLAPLLALLVLPFSLAPPASPPAHATPPLRPGSGAVSLPNLDPALEARIRASALTKLARHHAEAARSLIAHRRLAQRVAAARLRDRGSASGLGWTVRRTAIRFAADEAAGTIDATVTLDIEATRAGIRDLEFSVDPLDTFEVSDASGTPLPFALRQLWGTTFATVTLPRTLDIGESAVVRFRVAGVAPCAPDPFFGMTTCAVSEEIVFFAFMEFLPLRAAWSYEDYYDTGPTDFEIETPADAVALATSEFQEKVTTGDRALHRFKGRYSDAFPAFAYGRFDVFRAETPDKKPVRTYLHTGTREFGKAWADICADVVRYYDGLIAPYLYSKHDAVQAIEELGGGVGPQSTTFYVASALTTSPEEFFSDQLFAHEIAHSWWGGMVRSGDPYSPWLSEAFAEYSSRLYGYTRWPKRYEDYVYAYYFDVFRDFVPADRDVPMTGDAILSTDATTYFFVTYIKGSHVLRMLQWLLGDEAFFRGLSAYATSHVWDLGGPLVTPEAFRLALEEASGQDLGPFFQEWVYGTGYPVYRWAAEMGRDGQVHTVRLRVEQVQDGGTDFSLPVEAVVTTSTGERRTLRLAFSGRVADETFRFDAEPIAVHVNPSAWAWADSIPALQGDADGSNEVDGPDLVSAAWALGGAKYDEGSARYLREADFNRDGKNDETDLAVVLDGFGTRGRIE